MDSEVDNVTTALILSLVSVLIPMIYRTSFYVWYIPGSNLYI